MTIANQNKDGWSQQKLEFAILQQVNVLSLLLQNLAAIENYQRARMRILHFKFESQFLNSMELLNFGKHFIKLISLSSVHLKRAFEVALFIFLKINKELAGT